MKLRREKKKRISYWFNGFCTRRQPLPLGLSLDQLPTCVRCVLNTYPLNSQGRAVQLSVYMTPYSKMVEKSCLNPWIYCFSWESFVSDRYPKKQSVTPGLSLHQFQMTYSSPCVMIIDNFIIISYCYLLGIRMKVCYCLAIWVCQFGKLFIDSCNFFFRNLPSSNL